LGYLNIGRLQFEDVFYPTVACTTKDERVVEAAKTRIVAGVCVNTLFFIARTKNKARIPAGTQNHDISFDGVVSPVRRSCHELGPPLIRVVPH
jgi:hypothetical protein